MRNIDFNYTTSEIAIDSADYTIRIFDIKTLQEKKNFVGHKISSNTVHFSTDGKSLLTGGRDGYLNIWQVGNYKIIKSIPANEWAIYDIAYSHNSNLFATARRYKIIKIWDSKTFEILKVINKEKNGGHLNSVN